MTITTIGCVSLEEVSFYLIFYKTSNGNSQVFSGVLKNEIKTVPRSLKIDIQTNNNIKNPDIFAGIHGIDYTLNS